MNITADTIDSTLYDAFGQRQISTLYTQSNQYHVILEALPEFQNDPRKLDSLYVQGAATTTVAGAAASTSGRNTSAASSVTTLTASSNANSSTTQGTQLSSAASSSSSSSLTTQNNTVNNASSTASPTGSNLSTGTPTNALSSPQAAPPLRPHPQPNLGSGLCRRRRLHQHHAHSRAALRLHPFRDEALPAHHRAPGPVSRGNRILQCCRRLLAWPGGRRGQPHASATSICRPA